MNMRCSSCVICARDIPRHPSDAQTTKRGTPCCSPQTLQTTAYWLRVRLVGAGLCAVRNGCWCSTIVSDPIEKLVDMILGSPLPRPARGANGDVVRLSRDFRDLLEGLLCKIPAEENDLGTSFRSSFLERAPLRQGLLRSQSSHCLRRRCNALSVSVN